MKALFRTFALTALLLVSEMAYPFQLVQGWNLVGNRSTGPISVTTTFGDTANVQTVWKWVTSGSATGITYPAWAFYAPSLDASGTLASYAASKGYDVLTTIEPGEGFWVNATRAFTMQDSAQTATTAISNYMNAAYTYDASTLATDIAGLTRTDYCNGSFYVDSAKAKLLHVQNFVAKMLAYVQATKNSGASIDKVAVIGLFSDFHSKDLTWLPTECGPLPTGMASSMQPYWVPGVEFTYTDATAQINLM